MENYPYDFSIFEDYESNVRSYCRQFPAKFTKAHGCYLFDTASQSYLDFFSGAGALNYGHNNSVLKKVLIHYIENDGITHGLDMYTEAKENFISTLQEKILIPRDLVYKIQFTGPTGTNAVEAALKLARKATGRQNIFALMGAFHGMTLGSLALTSSASSRKGAGVTLGNVTHIMPPYMFKGEDKVSQALEQVETMLCDEHSGIPKPAAIIVETVQAEGGVHVMPINYLQGLEKICHEHDIVFIVDDIQVGCGRTGSFFSFEAYNIYPDIVTLSKSISGYGLPMALNLIKPQLDDFWEPGEHNGTFRGNQLAFITGAKALEMFQEWSLEAQTIYKGLKVNKTLTSFIAANNLDIQVRGRGLIIGVELPTEDIAKEVVKLCFEKHLIIERTGRNSKVLKILPPLVISEDVLMHGVDIVCECIYTAMK